MLSLQELGDRARDLTRHGGRRLLGLTGPPGAGKSTLATRLERALRPDAVVVPADGFHLAGRVLRALARADRKGAPDTFDVDGFHCLLRRLGDQSDEVVYAPEFVRRIEEPVAASIPILRTVPLVIVEGNYLLANSGPWAGTSEMLHEVWYIAVDDDLREARLVNRHQEFGRSEVEARDWALGSDQRNAEFIASTRMRADLVVAGPVP